MANNIGGSIGQLFRGNDPGNIKTGKVAGKVNTSSKAGNGGKLQKAANPFGESAKVELSPEVEMYGKVVDLLQKKYDNADVFVAGPGDDLSQIGGDLEYSIILKEKKLYENIFLNSTKNDIRYNTNNKRKRFIPLPSLSSIKLSSKKYKYKLIPSNKSNSLKTPTNKKMIKLNNNESDAYNYTYKKIYDEDNEFKYINKFVIDTADEKNDDTTVDLSTFNQNFFNSNIDKDFSSSFISNSKFENDQIIIYDNKKIEIEPFKDVFLKKLLNSKKLSNNLGKLFDLNQQKKKRNFNQITRNKISKQRIGYKLK